ncbi:hypothetical protein JCM8097_002937 [Rhodosporidiobolus ruineniae]
MHRRHGQRDAPSRRSTDEEDNKRQGQSPLDPSVDAREHLKSFPAELLHDAAECVVEHHDFAPVRKRALAVAAEAEDLNAEIFTSTTPKDRAEPDMKELLEGLAKVSGACKRLAGGKHATAAGEEQWKQCAVVDLRFLATAQQHNQIHRSLQPPYRLELVMHNAPPSYQTRIIRYLDALERFLRAKEPSGASLHAAQLVHAKRAQFIRYEREHPDQVAHQRRQWAQAAFAARQHHASSGPPRSPSLHEQRSLSHSQSRRYGLDSGEFARQALEERLTTRGF